MPRFAFEDFAPGTVMAYGDTTVSRDDIVAFAREFDPQPFHLGEEEAKGTFVGELIASGWHSLGLQMRMLCDAVLLDSTGLGAPGIEDIRWIAPVRPGDRLSVRQTVLDARASTSRPELGLVKFTLELIANGEETKMRQTNWIMFARRDAAGKIKPNKPALPAIRSVSEDSKALAPPLFSRFADQLEPGMSADLGTYTFDPDAIVAYARRFDPQSFHLDAEAAKRSLLGGLCASGWHTASIWCRLLTDARAEARRAAGGEVLAAPQYGSSPGFKDMKWLKPVFAGDTIRYRTSIVEARPSRSRPGWGIVIHDNTGENQHGERVFSLRGTSFWSLKAS